LFVVEDAFATRNCFAVFQDMKKRTIAIIGGGIGGLATALCLSRSGVDVRVFERRKYLREEGSGLSLWPNGTAVLAYLGLLPEVSQAGQIGNQVLCSQCLRKTF